MPTSDRALAARLRRRVAVLGLVTALGTGALVPLAGPAAAGSTATASTRTTDGPGLDRPTQLRRAVVRTAPRARLVARPAAPVSDTEQYQQRLLVLVNAERGRHGLHPLAITRCGDGYADRWADSMARRGVMEHQKLRAVLDSCGARAVAENVAYGTVTADRMMEMWMNSPGHRANILRPEMTHVGIGSTKRADGRVYGCQVFLKLS